MVIDIDFFKQYNDMYGHQKGDEALKSVSLAMKLSFKRANDYVYRLGGEEFAITFYINSIENAIERTQALIKSIEELKIEHKGSSVSENISISIGLTYITKECSMDPAEIYRVTDDTLYRAKKGGRNRVEVTAPANLL